MLRISSSYICSLACVLPACGQKKCTSLLGIPFDALPLTLARCSGRREHLSQHSGDISSPEDSPATYIHRRKGGAVQDIPVARGGQIDRPQVREAWEKAEQKIRDPQPLSNLMQVPLYPFSTLFFSPFPALVCFLSPSLMLRFSRLRHTFMLNKMCTQISYPNCLRAHNRTLEAKSNTCDKYMMALHDAHCMRRRTHQSVTHLKQKQYIVYMRIVNLHAGSTCKRQ